jgi:acyl-CoA dehydrogenase
MLATARRDGDEYVLNGNKTFITNGPYADTIVFICKLDEGNDPKDRKILSFVLDSGMPGLDPEPSRCARWACTPRPPASCSSTTCGWAATACSARRGPGDRWRPRGAKDTFQMERTGVAAMALGIVEQCLELSVATPRSGCSSASRSASSSSSSSSWRRWRSPA